ncbi:MAG TPA: hypothetical protein DCL77_20025 [Prolixibacteraceae bacterium]|jgi:plasmid stabilization system protein ParE|nr:hypothetical protein [Prolixibacteraceae bacterium]
MSCKAIFSSMAAKELQKSFDWYENRVQGLGSKLIDIIDNTIELILINPEGFLQKKEPFREASLKKFPYIIVYEHVKEKETVYLLHIFHTSRHPRIKYKRE